jgi:lysyl-tRNA synthetase class II
VIPVSTEVELTRRPQFSSVEDYTSYRNRQNVLALTEEQTRDQMLRMATRNSELETQRAFNLIKQDDYARRKQDEWWSSIRALKHA